MRRLSPLALVAVALAGCTSGAQGSSRAGRASAAQPAAVARPAAPASAAPPPAYAAAPPPRASQPAFTPTAAGPIPYDAKDLSFDQALANGRAAGKPVAFYILSSTCGFCTRLEASTLTDGSVQREMSRFYNV